MKSRKEKLYGNGLSVFGCPQCISCSKCGFEKRVNKAPTKEEFKRFKQNHKCKLKKGGRHSSQD